MPAAACDECGTPLDPDSGKCPSCASTLTTADPAAQTTVTTAASVSSDHGERFPRRFGRFTLLDRIGRGGMGVVYLAQDSRLLRKVALKTLPGMDSDPSRHERFLREARIAGTLDHPNLVPVYDFGTEEDTLFFTMPLVPGMSLEQALPYLHGTGDPPPRWLSVPADRMERIGLILRWFEGALLGLEHAHGLGIVHRDIKPSNLLLDSKTGLLRIADFGLARAGNLSGLTRAGAMMGTVAYMAPEQVRADAEQLDHRCDVYAMGVTLYRTLTNRLPYKADSTADYLNKILTTAPARASATEVSLPGDLTTVLLKTMEKSPPDRYPSAAALAEDLGRFRRCEPIRARPVGPGGRLVRWARRKPAIASMLAVLAVGVVVLSVLLGQLVRSNRVFRQQEMAKRFVDSTYEASAGDFETAIAGFTAVIERDPGHFDARMARALTIWHLNDPTRLDTALEDLEVAQRTQPELASIHGLRGRLLELGGRSAEAQRELSLASDRPPTTAIDFQFLGNLAWAEEDHEAAVALYDKALRIDPQLAWARFHRGLSHRKLGQHERARTDFEVVSGLWSDHALSHNNLGNALDSLGRYDDAAAAYERALRIDPDNPDIHANYGGTLMRMERLEDAERQLRRALELRPEHPEARNDLGRVFVKAGRLGEASRQFVELIRMEELSRSDSPHRETWANAHVNLCDVSLIRRDLAGAEEACSTCAELFPDEPNSHYNLAMLRALQSNYEGALESLTRDVELGDRDYGYLCNDEVFKPLRGDPRFQALVGRMGAPESALAADRCPPPG